MKLLFYFFTIPFLANCANPRSQPVKSVQQKATPFVLGVVDTIASVQLSEKRILNIYLPDQYAQDSTTLYPVIYLLDGTANEDFVHVTGVVQFLNMIGAMPPTIIVGIANVDRRRDFAFPTTIEADKKEFPTTGGSEKFIAFMEKELQPYVESHYRVNASKTLIGQSLGGLLATEVLLKKPNMFTDYIIVSPSLWWDGESLLNNADSLLSASTRQGLNVFMTVGDEGDEMVRPAGQLATKLQAASSQEMHFEYYLMPEETHLTILHNAVYKALSMEFYKGPKGGK